MQRIVIKSALSLMLTAIAGILLWYAVIVNRVVAKDWELIEKRPSAMLFPEVVYWWGNYFYYAKLDVDGAAQQYRTAIRKQPLQIDAWLDLAKVEMVRGNKAEAHRIVSDAAPKIAQVSYWKWKELLLAYDLQDEEYFAACYNFILGRLPNRVKEACDLALRFWGGWNGVMPHVTGPNRPALMRELMAEKALDDVISLWHLMQRDSELPDEKLLLDICDFTLRNGRIREAKAMWGALQGWEQTGIYDGGFENQPSNAAFGWRFSKHQQVEIGRSDRVRISGERALHLHFKGTENVSFSQISQAAPVKPRGTYRLTFVHRSQNITTDQGVFIRVSGYQCNMTSLKSRPITGTTPWEAETLNFSVPGDCEAILVQVCRTESLKFDNKISGDYWLDGVELEEVL